MATDLPKVCQMTCRICVFKTHVNALFPGRPAISPTHDNRNAADDLRSRRSSQSPAFSQREAHYERPPSTNISHPLPSERQPTSPPVRKINSLSVGIRFRLVPMINLANPTNPARRY
jgi:hypothetical protein